MNIARINANLNLDIREALERVPSSIDEMDMEFDVLDDSLDAIKGHPLCDLKDDAQDGNHKAVWQMCWMLTAARRALGPQFDDIDAVIAKEMAEPTHYLSDLADAKTELSIDVPAYRPSVTFRQYVSIVVVAICCLLFSTAVVVLLPPTTPAQPAEINVYWLSADDNGVWLAFGETEATAKAYYVPADVAEQIGADLVAEFGEQPAELTHAVVVY